MTADDTNERPLASDEVLVYTGSADTGAADDQPQRELASIRSRLDRIRGKGLEVVKIDDTELDRLRSQVVRITSRLEASDQTQKDQGFGVDEITLHVGLSASGQFFLVASAEVDAAIDITWRRHD